MTTLRVYLGLVSNDLRLEFRNTRVLVLTPTIGILLVLIVGMALGGPARLPNEWAAGLLWVVIFFMTAVTAQSQEARDVEFGAREALFMLPVDRSTVYYARWTSAVLFLWVAEALTAAAWYVLLHSTWPRRSLPFLFVLAAGGVCLSGISRFLINILGASSLRDVLFPLSLLPLAVPLLLALVRLTTTTLAGAPLPLIWVEVIVGYLVVFGVLPWLVYEILLEV
ncbi:MAG: heme exporter protein CcmB [Alicyclobacillus herbarius]|uniref:heme exporter protein CcmB n=1 Tax=Alicyclobacillus herbarius TaxID=122960 RepID=UPI0023548359|nr:heme exporter protein CcmB [Alicyclobacillus herbarius]MCL6631227.1 heme exporter protein CcmB [Alicyclobacillus herbarius]